MWPEPRSAFAKTDADGCLELSPSEPGEWVLELRPPGWTDGRMGPGAGYPRSFSTFVARDLNASTMPLELELLDGRIEGTVVLSDGSPVGSVAVDLHTRRPWTEARVLTDASGHFEFPWIGGGEHVVSVGGVAHGCVWSLDTAFGLVSRAVVVTAEMPRVTEVDFSIRPAGRALIRVQGVAGETVPTSGMFAAARTRPDHPWVPIARAQSDGSFVAEGLPPGPVELGFSNWMGPFGDVVTAEIEAGKTIEVNVRQRRTSSLTIVAQDEANVPLFFHVVQLVDRDGNELWIPHREEAEPLMRFDPLPIGAYRITIELPNRTTRTREIELTPGTPMRVVFRL